MIHDIFLLLPMTIIAIGAFVLLIVSTIKTIRLRAFNILALFFLIFSFLIELPQLGSKKVFYPFEAVFGQNYIIDDFSTLFDLMFLLGAIFTLLINTVYLKKRKYYNGEFFALFLFTVFGMMTLAHSNELITAFIALELASLSIYALVGYHKNNLLSGEAMFKYLVLGSVAGALFILGIALIYGATGSTQLPQIADYIHLHGIRQRALFFFAGMLMMVTILFKIGAVPFHAWVLDVYHGAPFPVTMFMASTFKIALFAVALRLFMIDFNQMGTLWSGLLSGIAIITLLGGSWLTLTQNILKRMLAGSSIVHGGYMLIAFSSIGLGSQHAAGAIMFYLLAYFISSVGAFGILSYIASNTRKQLTYEDFKGFSQRNPYLAAMMAIFMLSLSGFPSTIGFLGKFYIFTSAIETGQLFLAGLGIFIAFVSVYYYFKLIAMMYFYPTDEKPVTFSFSLTTVLIALLAVISIWGGIGTELIPFLPGADGFINIANHAMDSLQIIR